MLTLRGPRAVGGCDGLTRRDFLHLGALSAGAAGLSLSDPGRVDAHAAGSRDVRCILLFLVGGPSQLDTWDPKPDAPDSVRGPFRPIRTRIPGILLSEHFPLMATMAERYAIVRSVHHEAPAVHETGHQLLQTGRLFGTGVEQPHYGAVVSRLRGQDRNGLPPFVVLPGPIGYTGVRVSHGQGAGYLGAAHEPFVLNADPARPDCLGAAGPLVHPAFNLAAEAETLRDRYSRTTFGQSCLLARRLVEHGTRLVTVNMFDTVFNEVTWDCHADGGSLAVTLDDYRDTLCPLFDRAYTALLQDLEARGLLGNTLVVALGEFGRTPKLNPRGGRDHWPGVWSILFAGGSVRGGQVVGASDRLGTEPRDRPVSPADVAATIYRGLGIDPRTRLPGAAGRLLPLADGQVIEELFR